MELERSRNCAERSQDFGLRTRSFEEIFGPLRPHKPTVRRFQAMHLPIGPEAALIFSRDSAHEAVCDRAIAREELVKPI
jgi:hypothetical protein